MATVRRVAIGLAFLALAILLAQYSASLPRTAWFAKGNFIAAACACGTVPINLLIRSLRTPPERFDAAWWRVGPALAFVGMALAWGSFVLAPHSASKPAAWVLNLVITACFFLLLRIKKWRQNDRAASE